MSTHTPLIPREGWHVMHLFYQIDHSQWQCLSHEDQRSAKTRLTQLVQEIRSTPDTHLLTFATRSACRHGI
jgi:chlorite dismutase